MTTNNDNLFGDSCKLTPLSSEEKEYAVHSLCKLITFPTVSATAAESGAYVDCANYLVEQLRSLLCLSNIHFLPESPRNCPVVVAHWKGIDESLPVLLLNSHYDVVPANPNDWTVPPFKGFRKDGKIYGRGAQDMKCVCIQYIEALRKISTQDSSFRPRRSIYLTFVPDEEIGGSGMAAFLDSKLYKEQLKKQGIALALDEGLASTDNVFSVFYGERLPWWVQVTAHGNTGHGSRFIDNTAVEQLLELANKALRFRQGQRELLHEDAAHENCAHAVAAKKKKSLGDVTTLNITSLEAGVRSGDTYAYNCVPPVAKCSLDIRISPHVVPSDISEMLDTWCRECSKTEEQHHVEWGFIGDVGDPLNEHAITSTDAQINPWYGVFCHAMEKSMNLKIQPQVFPAATDSRFLRVLGIRALGFSPMRFSEILLHENDENIEEKVFCEGIAVYVGLLKELASQGKEIDEAAAITERKTTKANRH